MRASLVRLAAVALIFPAVPAFGEATQPAASADKDDKIICRKFVEVGSLVKKNKVCMTRSEWRRVQISQRDGAEKLVSELSGGYACDNASGGC